MTTTMALDFAANWVGVATPGAGAAIHAATALAQAVQNVKVNKFEAEALSRRCTDLALSCEDACKGLEGTEFSSIIDDITAIIDKATRRAQDWSSMNMVQSLLRQSSIRQGIETLSRDIDTYAHIFNIASSARLYKSHQQMDRNRERENDEIREMIRNIQEHMIRGREHVQLSQSSESTIEPILEIMRKGTPEEKELLLEQLSDIVRKARATPIAQDNIHESPVHDPIESDMNVEQTPETNDMNTPGSPRSFSNLSGSPALRPQIRSTSSSSSSDLGSSLTGFDGLDLTSVVRRNQRGYTSAGTFVGLVDELLRTKSNGYQRTHEYQEIFLTNYRLFKPGPGSLRDVLRLLFRRFTLSDSSSDPTFRVEDRVPIKHEVLVLLKMLLKEHYSNSIDVPLLEELLPAVQSISKSPYLTGQSQDLINTIERLIVSCSEQNTRFRIPKLAKSLSEPMHLVDFDHMELAFAMKLLEGAAYIRITPTDCITHLIDPKRPSPLSEARAVNSKLYNWVRRKILSRENLIDRRNTLHTFISVAHACRVDHNFSSMATIIGAINSPAISNLRSTRRLLDKEAVSALNNLDAALDSERYSHDYAKLLRANASKKDEDCIPWFSFHVDRLKKIKGRPDCPVVVEGRRLIDFERYRELSGEITKFLQFQTAHNVNYRAQQISFNALSYFEDELKKMKDDEQANKIIEELSLERQAQEDRDYNT